MGNLVSTLGIGVLTMSLGFSGVALAEHKTDNPPAGWVKNHNDVEETNFNGNSQHECDNCEEGGPGVRTEKEGTIGPSNNKHSIDVDESDGPPNPQGGPNN
jgi:hypothetical protein